MDRQQLSSTHGVNSNFDVPPMESSTMGTFVMQNNISDSRYRVLMLHLPTYKTSEHMAVQSLLTRSKEA